MVPTKGASEESAELARIARPLEIAAVQSNQQQKAIEVFETAQRLDPTDASDLLNIAVLQTGLSAGAGTHPRP